MDGAGGVVGLRAAGASAACGGGASSSAALDIPDPPDQLLPIGWPPPKKGESEAAPFWNGCEPNWGDLRGGLPGSGGSRGVSPAARACASKRAMREEAEVDLRSSGSGIARCSWPKGVKWECGYGGGKRRTDELGTDVLRAVRRSVM